MTEATIDFESKSQAGYFWNESLSKWEGPPGAGQGKKGLSVIGVVAYAQHPTTDILTMSWALPDGRTGRWRPGVPLYHLEPLFQWIATGGKVEAHNFAFEFWLWWCVCVPRYGFPPLPLHQGACSMATARVNQFPGGLGQLGTVLRLPIQKDKEGTRLLNKFSVPRKPTKSDPRFWITPDEDPVDGEKLYSYCDTDVAAERWASRSMPPMTPTEREFWLVDQEINLRGIAIDRKGVRDCIAVLNQALEHYGEEFAIITGGLKITEIAQCKGWLAAQGIYTDSLDAEHVELLLKRKELAPHVRRVLEIRNLIGSASVKKLFSMENMASAQDRLHNLIVHHGTRTGRPTGEGPQPLNLPKNGPKLATCGDCGQVFHPKHMKCPWCGVCRPPPAVEAERRISPTWRPSMVLQVLEVIATRQLRVVEHYLGDAVLCIMGCVRGLFEAGPGMELIESDYSAIEAVVTAMLAGEEWRINAFLDGEDIYVSSASKITGNPLSFYEDYFKLHGEKHPDRQYIGKVAELACLSPETEILTHLGYVALGAVTLQHKLWDGVEWVRHAGLVSRGQRATLRLAGVEMTPDHEIICGSSWKAASELDSHPNFLRQALANGSANLPSWARSRKDGKATGKSKSVATVAGSLTRWLSPICVRARARGAELVLSCLRALHVLKTIGGSPISSPILRTAAVFSSAFPLASLGATPNTQGNPGTKTMEGGASPCTPYGETERKVVGSFWPIWPRCRAGMSQLWSWTGSRLMAPTCRAICGSLRGLSTWPTNGRFPPCKPELPNLRDVYDIAHAGPRNRFTIRADNGHLIVHNCGFGGWIGAWRNFDDSDKFTDEEVKKTILAWRDASPAIVELWGGQSRGGWGSKYPCLFGFEGAAIAAVQNPGTTYTVAGIHFFVRVKGTPFVNDDGEHQVSSADALIIRLLSGRELTYHEPMLSPGTRDYDPAWQLELSYMTFNTNPKYGMVGWTRMKTYGARLTENIVQATAHCILRHAILALRAAGFNTVLHVYDSIMAEIPEGWPPEVLELFERIMSTMPWWAKGWPVRAAGGWRSKKYRKG